MREIKFRAWNKRTNTMHINVEEFHEGDFDRSFDTDSFGHTIRQDYIEGMQYTGLKDKNDVEIYEGDVVQFEMYSRVKNGVTELIETTVEHQIDFAKTSSSFNLNYLGMNPGTLAVIGNIYEDGHLLNNN